MILDYAKELRKDSKNYKWNRCIYFCKEDPYIIVPKRIPWMGWTFNFAHPKAWPMLFYVSFAVTAPFLFTIYLTTKNNWPQAVIWIFMAINITLLCLWSHKEATKSL